jgi:hypothetical protein
MVALLLLFLYFGRSVDRSINKCKAPFQDAHCLGGVKGPISELEGHSVLCCDRSAVIHETRQVKRFRMPNTNLTLDTHTLWDSNGNSTFHIESACVSVDAKYPTIV